MPHKVTLIPGDGTGPEITEATRRVLEGTGVAFEWDVQHAGESVIESAGTPLPDEVLASIRRNKVAIKGPITTPVGHGFRSVNVALRKQLDLYACLRPCKTYKGVRSRYDDIDIVIVRENLEDLYAGIEFREGSPEALHLIDVLEELGSPRIREDSGISIKPISVTGSRRIVRFAFEYARRYDRHKVTAVHKSNIMKFSGCSSRRRAPWRRSTRISGSRTGSSTTAACNSWPARRSTTSSSYRISMATS